MSVVKMKAKPKTARMFCSNCDAEGTAGCDCGVAYIPARKFAEKVYASNPSISVRELAETAGVSHGTAQNVKSGVQNCTPETTTKGKDGKNYKATRSKKPKLTIVPDDECNLLSHELEKFTSTFRPRFEAWVASNPPFKAREVLGNNLSVCAEALLQLAADVHNN